MIIQTELKFDKIYRNILCHTMFDDVRKLFWNSNKKLFLYDRTESS